MTRNLLRLIVLFSFTVLIANRNRAAAQDGAKPSVTLPVLGYVFDAGGLRPLIGIAGSASVGRALDLGFAISDVAVPPAHDYVLVLASDKSWPRLLQFRANGITVQSLGSLVARSDSCNWSADESPRRPRRACQTAAIPSNMTFDRVSLSPTGSAAALFSQSQGRIYVFVNLAQAPTLLGAFSVPDAAGLNTFAITDDGRTAALGFSSGDTGSLYIQTLNGAIRPIPSLQRVSAVAFLRGSDTLIAADDAQNEIYSVTGGQVVTIATADNGVAGPVAVASSNDNQRILVANASAGSVTVIGPTGISDPLSCHCTLSGLYPTNADSVFRLTQFSGGPVLLVDAAGATPRLIFARNSSSH